MGCGQPRAAVACSNWGKLDWILATRRTKRESSFSGARGKVLGKKGGDGTGGKERGEQTANRDAEAGGR